MSRPAAGAKVYVEVSGSGWVGGVVSADAASVQVEGAGQPVSLKKAPSLPRSGRAKNGVPDMIALDLLNEGAIQENVYTRYTRGDIYTSVGPILISVNPYKSMGEQLYGDDVADSYAAGLRSPHLFASADAAYMAMMNSGTDQAVLISGESGAGKTEATKIVLRYLTRRADRGAGEPTEAPASDGSIQDKILQANPVLEAFGNAKTLRNNNSSRFGKYFTIDFSQSGGVVSGTLTDYLLEKSRVVSQAEGERNYHIFYQLCAGAPAELKAQLGVGDAASHNYTKTCVQNDTDDLADWVEMDEALSLFAEAQTKTDVYRIVGALLNLGDVAFEAAGEASQVSSAAKGALGRAAKLIKVDAERLMLALCERSITTGKGRSTYTIKLKPEDAVSNRDALAKEVYSRLFSWLVHHIDAGMHLESKQGSSSRKASIGVLDIFGFEVLATNSLEQMLINYTNEKLHFQFCHYYFTLEQHEYEKEGVTWESIEFCDNAACLSLLERKLGVFDVLQDACRQPKTDDTTFADNLKGTLISDPNFGRAKFDPTGFAIHHFARSVEYSSHGMLEKNKDQLFTDLELVLTLSEDKFLQELQGGGKLSRGTAVAGATVARQFTESINKLMATLNATQPHYIRCIKCVTLKTMNAPQCCEHVWVAA